MLGEVSAVGLSAATDDAVTEHPDHLVQLAANEIERGAELLRSAMRSATIRTKKPKLLIWLVEQRTLQMTVAEYQTKEFEPCKKLSAKMKILKI